MGVLPSTRNAGTIDQTGATNKRPPIQSNSVVPNAANATTAAHEDHPRQEAAHRNKKALHALANEHDKTRARQKHYRPPTGMIVGPVQMFASYKPHPTTAYHSAQDVDHADGR